MTFTIVQTDMIVKTDIY